MEPVVTLILALADSPWRGLSVTHEEEEASKLVVPQVLDASWERFPPLEALFPDLPPLLALNKKGRYVRLNRDFFSSWVRADATALASDDAIFVGQIKGALAQKSPELLFRFLLQSHLVETSVHIEAELTLSPPETISDGSVRQRFTGFHAYYTNEQNKAPLDFYLRLDKGCGDVWLEGPDA